MKKWFVVRTKAQLEGRALWHLKNQGFDAYLPRYRKQIRHARKMQTVLRPLFPGYVFVSMDMAQQRWRSINGTAGVISLVQFGNKPAVMSSEMIDVIRGREDQEGAVCLAPDNLQKGDRVCIHEGSFADFDAIIDEVSGDKRVFLMLELLGRAVRVSAPIGCLAKAP